MVGKAGGSNFRKQWPLLSAVPITEVTETKPTNGSQHSDTQTASTMDEPGSLLYCGPIRFRVSRTG